MSEQQEYVPEPRITKEEQQLLKSVFYNNDKLLLAVRNLFFGFEITKDEASLIKTSFDDQIKAIMRKVFLPELGRDIPLTQSIDLWMTVDLKDKTEEDRKEAIAGRYLLLKYIETALNLLNDLEGEKVELSIEDAPEDYAELLARNTFITHIEQQLAQIKVLTIQNETPEERKERQRKDSNK